MSNKYSRRDFLKLGVTSAAVLAASGTLGRFARVSAQDEIVLDILINDSDLLDDARQIWDIFEAENPGIRANLYSINNDQEAAYQARLAGGYLPAIDRSNKSTTGVDATNYELFVDLSTIDFPHFDRWQYDVRTAWSDLYGLPGPRTLDFFQGFIFSYLYHVDLMERSGLDPRRDVRTWEDLLTFLEEGTRWAEAEGDVDHFLDIGYQRGIWGQWFPDLFPLAFADGTRQMQRDVWLGRAPFNGPESPYRHYLEFMVEANERGWIPPNSWTRDNGTDTEASFVARRSVMLLHGPWNWSRAQAANPDGELLGFPSTPSAEGNPNWYQFMSQLAITDGDCIRTGNEELDTWEAVKTAFFWWNGPSAVPLRALIQGRDILYTLDEPFEVDALQVTGFAREIGNPDGLYPEATFTTETTGETAASPFRIEGSKGAWDWEAGGMVGLMRDLMTGAITVQEGLDQVQANWEESYSIEKQY